MQKINYFHLLILEIQSILEASDQIAHNHNLIIPNQKKFETLNFCEFVSKCKKFLQSDWLRAFWPISQ